MAPDARLLQRCEPAGVLNAPAIREIVADLLASLPPRQGPGIAAPQIGRMYRIFVMAPHLAKGTPVVFIDPEILWRSDETDTRIEHCLSRPDKSCHVTRPVSIRLGWYDLYGRYHAELLEGPRARAAQHLADHLDGRLISET
nr:peptide deformylase [Paracoccus sp. C2R09]